MLEFTPKNVLIKELKMNYDKTKGEFYTYMYLKFVNGKERMYIGRGKDASKGYKRAYDIANHNEDCQIFETEDVIILSHFHTEDESTADEAKRIKERGLDNLVNRREELTDNKYAKLLGLLGEESASIASVLAISIATYSGEDQTEPMNVAYDIINNIPAIKYESVAFVSNNGLGTLNMIESFIAEHTCKTVQPILYVYHTDKVLHHAIVENDIISSYNKKGDKIKMINTDFLAYDFKDQRFDLVLMNPPFNRQAKFRDQALKTTNLVAMLGTKALGGTSLWKKYGENISYFKYVSFDGMGVGVETAAAIIDVTKVNKKYANLKERYPLRLPQLRNDGTLEDYDKAFDQINGIKQDYRDTRYTTDFSVTGIIRDGKEFIFVKDEELPNVLYYPISTAEKAKPIIDRLNDICFNKMYIDPRYGFGHKKSIQDLQAVKV